MKRNYDFAFSLGESCTCSEVLRRVGMQFASFPFDWISAFSIRIHADLIATDFADLMPLDKLVCQGINEEQNAEMVVHTKTGMRFYHDFPPGGDLRSTYAEIRQKYDRRIRRLQEYLSRDVSVLAVYVHAPMFPVTSDSDLGYAVKRMRDRFPDADIDLLYIYNVSERGFSSQNIEQVSEHVFKIGMDIRMPPGSSQFISNRKKVVAALHSLFPHGIADYRTKKQIREYREAVQRRELEKYHAKNVFEYYRNRFYWLIFRHFRNRLERAGFTGIPSHRALVDNNIGVD